jgi:hypothetical protein
MRTLVALATLLLALTACGSEGEDETVTDPGGSSAGSTEPEPEPGPAAMPATAPVPAGEVRTVNLATVMDTGTPELCLGAIAESYPPQCGGPGITNWDWKQHGQQMFEQQGDIRWGTFAVTGTWDGTAFAVTATIPGPLYDPMPLEPTAAPSPAASYSADELAAIQTDLEALPGFQGAYATEAQVTVEVMYDDGSLQAWADEEYGAGVVLVSPLLVDA